MCLWINTCLHTCMYASVRFMYGKREDPFTHTSTALGGMRRLPRSPDTRAPMPASHGAVISAGNRKRKTIVYSIFSDCGISLFDESDRLSLHHVCNLCVHTRVPPSSSSRYTNSHFKRSQRHIHSGPATKERPSGPTSDYKNGCVVPSVSNNKSCCEQSELCQSHEKRCLSSVNGTSVTTVEAVLS